MDLYNIWCDLKPGVRDLEFVSAVRTYLDGLKHAGHLHDYRIMRGKLGLGIPELPEWHLQLEFTDLTQLDAAFTSAATRTDPVESFHHAVNSKVARVRFGLYRDFPDAVFLGYRKGDLPVTERVSGEVLSLPMYAELTDAQIDRVTTGVAEFMRKA